jgi:glutathione peroxidase-family protein
MADFTEAKGFILIFTCNHCPYSIVYEDRIIDLDKKYKSQGFPVIAINPNDPEVVAADSYENMIKRSTEKGFTFPYLFDEGQKVYPKYGATRTPHVYIVNKEAGKFIVKYIGAIDDNDQNPDKVKKRYIEMAVESLLKGEKVAVTETKAIGCTIKKKK